MRIPTGLILVAMCYLTTPSLASEMVKLAGPDGTNYEAFAAGSENSKIGILLFHDWFGVSEATKTSATRLAQNGARVLAVDLYQGKVAISHDQAQLLMDKLDNDYVQGAIRASMKALWRPGRPIAVIGYSMGGLIALKTAVMNPERVQAVALVYGGGYDDVSNEDIAAYGKPVLVVSGSSDDWSYPELLNLQDRAHDLGTPVETYVYPGADHAFEQKLFNTGNNFDPQAKDATETILDSFLQRAMHAMQ